MSPIMIDKPAFAEILAQSGWADIDSLYMACKESNIFGSDFYDRAIEIAMKEQIRRMLKSGKVKDADGNTINVASIIMTDKNGKKQRVYKQETLFEVDDFVQVVRYWKDSAKVCQDKLDYYIDLAVTKFGRQVQGLLDLGD